MRNKVKYILILLALVLSFVFVSGSGGCGCQGKVGNKIVGFEMKAGMREVPKTMGILKADPRA